MIRTAARFLLLRVLPRRLVPIFAVVEVVQLLRAARRQRACSRAREDLPAGGRRTPEAAGPRR